MRVTKAIFYLSYHNVISAKDSTRMIGWQRMIQPIKSHIECCFTQSCKWSVLLESHTISCIKIAFFNFENIRHMNMKLYADIVIIVKSNILPVCSKIYSRFWDMGGWHSMILVGVAKIRLIVLAWIVESKAMQGWTWGNLPSSCASMCLFWKMGLKYEIMYS